MRVRTWTAQYHGISSNLLENPYNYTLTLKMDERQLYLTCTVSCYVDSTNLSVLLYFAALFIFLKVYKRSPEYIFNDNFLHTSYKLVDM